MSHGPPPRSGSVPPPSSPDDAEPRRESALADLVRRALEKGLEAGINTLSKSDGALRGALPEGKAGREFATYVMAQLDETKNGVMRIVGREIRGFLQAVDVPAVFENVLRDMKLQVKMEVQFAPRDGEEGLRPQIIRHEVSTTRSPSTTPPFEEPPPDEPER